MNEIPAYQKPADWHFASMRYGDYVAFNGDSDFAMLVESILRQPKEYLKILEGTSVNLDIAYNKVAESFRESTNGHKYNWYARFNGYDEGEICKFMALVLNHGLIFTHIFNNLSEDSEFQGLSALESIPRIKEKLSIKLIQDNDSLIQKIKFTEVQEKSVIPQVNEIALEVIRQLEERDKLNVTQNDHQSIELNKLIDSQKVLIDALESSVATLLSEQAQLDDKLMSSQMEVGNKTDLLMKKEDSALNIFSSIFPQFRILNKNNFFNMLLTDVNLTNHIKGLYKIHHAIFKDKKTIEDLEHIKKISGLESWYRLKIEVSEANVGDAFNRIYDQSWSGGIEMVTIEPRENFMISYSSEYGNDKYFILFGTPDAEEILRTLEQNDPPRDNLEKGI